MTDIYGPAGCRKEVFIELGERSCINVCGLPLELVLIRAIMDICARAISLEARPRWAVWVTSDRRCREDRSSISVDPLADLARERYSLL
jgi:hypothetical protein